MTTVPAPVSDWNAADADRVVKKPGLLGRFALGSPKASTKRALKDAGARAIAGSEAPRLHNIVTGLAERLSLGRVDLFVIEEGGPNALTGRVEAPCIAVTTALLDAYARTELEAVIAHCLVRHREAGRRGAMVGFSDDVRAVALTRYPPALVAAIEKAEPYKGRFAGHYMVADGPTHRPVPERARALTDL